MKKILKFHNAADTCSTEVAVLNEDYYLLNEYSKIRNEGLNNLFYTILREYFKNHEDEFKEIKRKEYLREISRHEEAINRAKEKIEELEQKGETEV